MRPVSILALAAALALASGCGTADEPVVGDVAPGSTAPSEVADGPPPHFTDEELARMELEGFPVANAQGLQGEVTQAEFEAQTERVNRHLRDAGTVTDEVREAYQVIEAIEVRDGDELVGYFTSHLVSVEDYPAELARAEALVAGEDDRTTG